METENEKIASALEELAAQFVSVNELNRDFQAANVVDGLFAIAVAAQHIAKSLEDIKDEMKTNRVYTTLSGSA